jgi:hypothetical protein
VFWKLGKVEELLLSKDGIVRAARVKVQGDGGKQVILRRPIQHLIPLEVRAEEPEIHGDQTPINRVGEEETQINPVEGEEIRSVRPRRKAAIAADHFRAQLDL